MPHPVDPPMSTTAKWFVGVVLTVVVLGIGYFFFQMKYKIVPKDEVEASVATPSLQESAELFARACPACNCNCGTQSVPEVHVAIPFVVPQTVVGLRYYTDVGSFWLPEGFNTTEMKDNDGKLTGETVATATVAGPKVLQFSLPTELETLVVEIGEQRFEVKMKQP